MALVGWGPVGWSSTSQQHIILWCYVPFITHFFVVDTPATSSSEASGPRCHRIHLLRDDDRRLLEMRLWLTSTHTGIIPFHCGVVCCKLKARDDAHDVCILLLKDNANLRLFLCWKPALLNPSVGGVGAQVCCWYLLINNFHSVEGYNFHSMVLMCKHQQLGAQRH